MGTLQPARKRRDAGMECGTPKKHTAADNIHFIVLSCCHSRAWMCKNALPSRPFLVIVFDQTPCVLHHACMCVKWGAMGLQSKPLAQLAFSHTAVYGVIKVYCLDSFAWVVWFSCG